jgi:hypothetical protein
MEPDEFVYEFLSKKENLSTALEIASYVEVLKITMFDRFWRVFNLTMRNKLESEIAVDWGLDTFPNINKEKAWQTYTWRKANLVPNNLKDPNYYLDLAFGQGDLPDAKLFWGVQWNLGKMEPKNFNHPELSKLQEKLKDNSIQQTDRRNHWIFWDYYKVGIFNPDILSGLYFKPDLQVQEIVDDVWNLFTDIRHLLEVINNKANTNA